MSTTELARTNDSTFIRFSVTDETIKPMSEKYLTLKINGIEDKVGYEIVKEARSKARKARTTVEAEREAAKKEYLEAGRKVDAAAKSLTAKIVAIEDHLVKQMEAVDNEVKRIEEERLDDRLSKRMDFLADVGGVPFIVAHRFTPAIIRVMTSSRFDEFLKETKELNERLAAEAKSKKEAEDKAAAERAAIEESNRLEREKLAAERAEFERKKAEDDKRIAAERAAYEKRVADERAIEQKKLDEQRAVQKAESDRLAGVQKKIDDEAAEKQRLADIERQAKAQSEAIEAKRIENQKLAEELEAKRVAALPIKQKIREYKDRLLAVESPNLGNEHNIALMELRQDIAKRMEQLVDSI